MRIVGCDLHARQQTVAMLDTMTGEVVTRVSVSGSFDPVEITMRTGTDPTRCSRAGDRIPGSQQRYKCSRWSLYSRIEKTDSDLEHHVVDVLNQLDANSDVFKQLSVELDGVMQLVAYSITTLVQGFPSTRKS